MAKILKNTTATDIDLKRLGLDIPANGSITVNEEDYLLLASADSISELTPLINSGDVVVNDGVADLSAAEALNFLAYPDTAENVRFLSEPERSNNLVSKDVQLAIEEVYNILTDTDRTIIIAGRESTTANSSKYLSFFKGAPSNQTQFVVPASYQIKELSLSNEITTTATFSVLVNNTQVATISLTNSKTSYVTGLAVNLVAGDLISVKSLSGTTKQVILSIFMKHL